jgi:molybdopterin/thiamine biosynthesis adenylyltransferase
MMADLEGRFDRHRLVPGWDQRRLADATAVVVGMGALGNEVARLLAMCGVGRLMLCDPDRVATSNLSRCSLFRATDVGRLKVDAAADALAELQPGIVVNRRPLPLVSGVGLAELRDADVVMGCLDSKSARLQLAGRCNLVRAGWIDGGTNPWGGEVRPYLDPDGPCYGCGLTAAERGSADVPWSCVDVPAAGPEGAAAPASAIVGAWQVMLATRHLFGLPVPADLMAVDGVRGTTRLVTVARAADCPLHVPIGDVRAVPVSNRDTVGSLLAAIPPASVPLAWAPAQRSASCARCGHVVPGWRVPAVEPCPNCGSLLLPETTLDLDAAPATAELADLGVAPREILAVRTIAGIAWTELR